MPIAKLLGMPEDSKKDLTSSQRDENEQLKIILQHWSNKNNVVEDLSALREALESLKQEGNLSRHFPLFFFLSSLVFFFGCEATRLRSRLIQVEHVTSLGCMCPKPASFQIIGCKYVCMNVCMYIVAFASISRTAFEIEARSQSIDSERKQKSTQNTNNV